MSSHRGHHYSAAGTSTDEPQDWRATAACRDADPDLFFPIDYGRARHQKAAEIEAKRICALCPSIVTCLESALAEDDRHAIRGGLTPDERSAQFPRRPKKRTPAYPCAVCGIGMGAPKNKGNNKPRYCSDTCRAESKKRRQAEYAQKRKAVAV